MIYITGDIHGELCRFKDSEIRKVKKGDTLIVCGDFGFLWDGGKKEEKVLKKLGNKKYTILFLDGTHENFDLLNKYPVTDWNGGKVHHICGNLYHLMRGQVYEIEGKKIFAFGGGDSGDKLLRTEAGKWWACEMPSLEEMRAGLKNLKTAGLAVDYIVTHEPPPRMDNIARPGSQRPESRNQLQAFFTEVARQVQYQKWFFGSIHTDRKITYKNYAVFTRVLPAEEPARGKHLLKNG